MITLLAVLKAKPGQTDALRKVLQGLLLPTRQEPGNLDYALFQLRDAPDTFYMRESWRDQQALDEHIDQPYFQAFIGEMDSLLAEPLRLDYLTPVAPFTPLGPRQSAAFSTRFLAIWLDPRTTYPELRQQLIGGTP